MHHCIIYFWGDVNEYLCTPVRAPSTDQVNDFTYVQFGEAMSLLGLLIGSHVTQRQMHYQNICLTMGDGFEEVACL